MNINHFFYIYKKIYEYKAFLINIFYMNKNMITIKIFSKENDNQLRELNEYSFNLSNKIIDVKTHILKDLYGNKYNNLDFENITERVYKDFGKLFFEKGLLPNTIDNYKLEQFTSENRTFSFFLFVYYNYNEKHIF